MALTHPVAFPDTERSLWTEAYTRIRQQSEALCTPLEVEDYVIQTAPEASPAKWHLAHISWFFETFLLKPYLAGYCEYHPQFAYLFNSYYEQVGKFQPRHTRGFLARPSVASVFAYRAQVDACMLELINAAPQARWSDIQHRLAIGLNHEQQHQELLLTDIKLNFSANPLRPVYDESLPVPAETDTLPVRWLAFPSGLHEIGHEGVGFAYDNESPRHRVYMNRFRLASRLVTAGEYQAFMEDGGYDRPEFWLSDAWATVREQGWKHPLYWQQLDGLWWQFTLGGMRPVNLSEPVAHVSYYEADAFASWAGKRLPTEDEWEVAAAGMPIEGNLRDDGWLHPVAAGGGSGVQQMYGDVWEHTASAYRPYPGYRPDPGALGEYNGKFMSGQMVSRGGSCLTPADHIRPSYRNFFYPHERWQCLGIRLAEDGA